MKTFTPDQTAWEILGLSQNDTLKNLDQVYRELSSKNKGDFQEIHLAWKLLSDPLYSLAHRKYSILQLTEAGFFDDGLDPQKILQPKDDFRYLTTPFHKILKNITQLNLLEEKTKDTEFVILLNTGSYAPIHQGHLEMMEIAKAELEQQGKIVLGGYFSPSHEKYVSTKYPHTQYLSASHRLALCQKAVAYSTWLLVDPWEALYTTVPINFSDVIVRLEAYLNYHLKLTKPLKVVYVFGSDNAVFARAFCNNKTAICVTRPGYEDRATAVATEPAIQNSQVIFTQQTTQQPGISSTMIRNGQSTFLASEVKELLHTWQFASPKSSPSVAKKYTYLLRDDLHWATQNWQSDVAASNLSSAIHSFKKKVATLLKNSFQKVELPDQPIQLAVEFLNLDKQQKVVNTLEAQGPVLNLDVCTESTYKIHLSRLFGLADGQCGSQLLVARPGYPALTDQLKKLPPSNYTLVEDDIASGTTVKYLSELLPPQITITQTETLLYKGLTSTKLAPVLAGLAPVLDVLDLRDFLLGARDSGLVVTLPTGQVVRTPYVLPYVSLVTRAKLPPSQELAFSVKIWQLNCDFFRTLAAPILVNQTDPAFQALVKYLGFSKTTSLLQICEWHLEQLSLATGYSSKKAS